MPPSARRTLTGYLFGSIVKRLRTERGWTLSKLALRSGMNATYLGVLEKGGNAPSLHTLFDLAEVFNVEPADIVREMTEGRRAAAAAQGTKLAARSNDPQPPEE